MLLEELQSLNLPVPENRPARPGDHDLLLRNLDCSVINLCMRRMDRHYAGPEHVYYQTVRGVFVEGEPAYPGAKIHTKTHIQIAVRDTSCILGYFKPVQFVAATGGTE
jgi:hypothetical protein